MERPILISAIRKLAIAGEHAGFSIEQMIQLLDEGISVEALIDLIAWSLEHRECSHPSTSSATTWVM